MTLSFNRPAFARLKPIALPVLLVLAAVATAAYAGTPPPVTNLQAAQQAIANAERVDAASMAAVELGAARAKLSDAEKAVAAKEMVVGAQLADEARADAELAAALTGAAKAKAVNADIMRSTATLQQEMQRTSGDTK
jgi:Domain of unknown function (DUF4398)